MACTSAICVENTDPPLCLYFKRNRFLASVHNSSIGFVHKYSNAPNSGPLGMLSVSLEQFHFKHH